MGALQVTEDFIFRSKLPDIEIPNHMPLHSYCFQNISSFSTRPCIINAATGEIYSYAEVELIARKVAAGIDKFGVKRGDIIMLLLPNSPEFVFTFLGVSYRGAAATTANPFYTKNEISNQVKASKPKLIVTQSAYVDKVIELARDSDIKIICTDSAPLGCFHFSDLTSSDETKMPVVEIHPNDVVALPYSSGTTGMPKGVMLTHKGMVTSIAQQVDGDNPNVYLHNQDVLLCVLPLFHIYSLSSVLLCGLRVGATILVMQKFEVVMLLEFVQKYKVTIAPFVPPIVLALSKSAMMDKYDLSSIRTLMSGAAPLGKELEDKLRAQLPNVTIGQGYGMTEAGSVISVCLAFAKEPMDIKSGSCGTVVRNAEMKIINPDTGLSLPYNMQGEICIRGSQIMEGYLNDPEATQRTIDKQGWLHTGDIGYIDENEELYIVDRLKELIKYKGFQVAPAELEALLISHPNIHDAAVVPMKDDVAGEVPVAFIVKSNGSEITEDDIKHYIAKQVVFYKRINRVFFVGTIPKSPSGKILRKDLQAKLTDERFFTVR